MGKQVDKNDFWFIQKNPITKVGVFPYLGRQISADCEPDKIYMVLRPKEELFRKETLDSLKLLPLVDEHTMLGKDFTPAEEKGIDGILGEQVVHDTDTIYTDIKIFSEEMKELIRNGKKELSLGYFCTYDKQEGIYNGQRYDYIQKNIIGNHLALVDKGRMGSDVRVYDKAIETNKMFCCDSLGNIDIENMKYKTNKGEEKMTELEKFLTGKISQDEMEEVKKIVEKEKKEGEDEDEKDVDKKEDKDKAPAKDKCGKDEDKDKDKDDKDKAGDEDDKDKDKEPAKDGDGDDKDKDTAKDSKGMDEAEVVKMFARKEKLGKEVEAVTGTFDHSEMTEQEIAVYACDKLGLKAEKGQEIATVKGFLKGVEKQKVEVKMRKTEDSDVVVEDKSFDNYMKNAKK